MEHQFQGKWISNDRLSNLQPRNVFHRQLDKKKLDCSQYRNQHVLFRKRFTITAPFLNAKLYISADDYYKLYINGAFVAQGPSPSYHFRQNYNVIDLEKYLVQGENVIAVHTLYQGEINRVWQSGDFRHGLICDLVLDSKVILSSDESFLVADHSAYTESGICGYQTQILEQYDSRAKEVGFERPDFDDSTWENACICRFDDHILLGQKTAMLEFEKVFPKSVKKLENRWIFDFGSNYVGYLSICAKGTSGDVVTIRCAQELNDDGTVRYTLRANCKYEEDWILSDGDSRLDWFDYKSFRYAELVCKDEIEFSDVCFMARHYPFTLNAQLKQAYANNADLKRIWDLCVHTQQYGVQEVIQDCMEREKGFYLGDGCYTALTNMILTHDDSMVRKLIDDAFASDFITDTLVTCLDCSFMQEIAEFPLIMICLILWHYRFTSDVAYLNENYSKAIRVIEAYRRDYEKDGLLRNLDKWCVVEWPKNFRDGYDAEIHEGSVCTDTHISINAYYLYAIRILNTIAEILGKDKYRDMEALQTTFYSTFYRETSGLFVDREGSEHVSLIGNCFAYALGLCPNEYSKKQVLKLFDERGVDSLSLFCTFPVLMRLVKDGEKNRLQNALLNDGAWKRMLTEDATTTFEGWGKDTKWNTSLFHLTMSYAAVFLADVDTEAMFE